MKKIAALHSFIANLNLFAAEQMDSCVDDLTVTPACRPHANPGQIVVAEKDYTATFFIERYPFGHVSEDALLAQVSAWLLEQDPDRLEPAKIELTIDVLDTKTANLEFGITFTELIIAEEHHTGTLHYGGRRYEVLA